MVDDIISALGGLKDLAVIFLCGLETVSEELDRELVYVGLSRAKSRIMLVGTERATRELLGKTPC